MAMKRRGFLAAFASLFPACLVAKEIKPDPTPEEKYPMYKVRYKVSATSLTKINDFWIVGQGHPGRQNLIAEPGTKYHDTLTDDLWVLTPNRIWLRISAFK